MTFLFYFYILLNNCFYALRRTSNKVWVVITLVFIFLLIAGAGPFYSFHADYDNYYRNYYSIMDRGIFDNNQIGYSFIMIISNLIGLPFVAFRLIVIGACIFILYKYVIKKYDVNVNYVLSLYLIYAIIIDSEQFRNWIAFTILLTGVPLLESSKIKEKMKFGVIWLISISFHYSFVFFAPLLLVNGKNRNKLITRLVCISVIFTSIIILNGNQIPFQAYLFEITDNRVIISYLTTQTNFGYLIPMVLHGSSVLLSYLSRKIIQEKHAFLPDFTLPNQDDYEINKKAKRELAIANVIYWANVSMLVVLPLYIVNVQFYRLMRSLLLITYIICAKASGYLIRRTNNLLFNVLVLASVFMWLYLDLVYRIDPGRLLLPFFLENIL